MSDPRPSLVEVLEALPRFSPTDHPGDMRRNRGGDYVEASDVMDLAAPYAARLAALERVAAAVRRCLDEDGEMREDCGLEPVAYLKRIFHALAAVPEIKETPTDGS